ncbi:MAG: 2-dehydropantoate 2-reductase N-terminal domain-containing protein, partial [Chloroflexota bacterium]
MGKRIAVLGAGGIGGSVGFSLSQAGHDVTLIDQWAEHVQTMQRRGLTLTDVNQEATVPVKALHLSDVSNVFEPFDIVFLSVKSYDTPWMAQLIAPHLGPGSFVLPTQNALNDETVARVVGYGRTVGCVTTISAGVYEPGHVVRTDPT